MASSNVWQGARIRGEPVAQRAALLHTTLMSSEQLLCYRAEITAMRTCENVVGWLAVLAGLSLAIPAAASRADEPGKGPVKVFIMAGQSNVEGHGLVEFGGVAFVDTRDYYRPGEQSPGVGDIKHWFSNAETCFLIGDGMGRVMKRLVAGDTESRPEDVMQQSRPVPTIRWFLMLSLCCCPPTTSARAQSAAAPAMPPYVAKAASPEQVLEQLSEDSDKTRAVKKFDPAWVRTLDQRGEPIVYTRKNSADFDYIGMPIGGICAGQLYLGGDGKLWCWDIFNTKSMRDVRGVPTHPNPYRRSEPDLKAHHQINQGFSIAVRTDAKTITRTLDRDGFRDIEFRGQYPIGFVKYADKDLPVEVELEAFSPFVPLDFDDSTYPATVLVDQIVFTDDARAESQPLAELLDFGSMCLALLEGGPEVRASVSLCTRGQPWADAPLTADASFDEPPPFPMKTPGCRRPLRQISTTATDFRPYLSAAPEGCSWQAT